MSNRVDEYGVLFHSRARTVFFSLCQDFKFSIASLDRQRDENVFQRVQANHVAALRRRLQEVALEVVAQLATDQSRDRFHHFLALAIDEYINEFVQKAKSL